MSIGQTFPHAIVLPNGWLHLVTRDARCWAHQNTSLSDHCDKDDIPRMIDAADAVPYLMKEEGLIVRWPKTGPLAYKERVPEWRKKYPKWQGEKGVLQWAK